MALVCRNEARLVSLRNNWLEPEENEEEYFEREVTAEVFLEKKNINNFESFMRKHKADIDEGDTYVEPDGEIIDSRLITVTYDELVGYNTSSEKIMDLLRDFIKAGGDYIDHNIVRYSSAV